MTPVIDIHAHAMPLPILQWLADRDLADLSSIGDRIVRIDPRISGVGAGAPLPLAPSMIDPRARLAEMDATGVDVEAVSLPPFLIASMCDDVDLVFDVVQRGNDALAEYCAVAPDRLWALGSIPVGTEDAVAEAERCLATGMRGIAIGSRGAGRELDDPINEPLWAMLSEREVFVFLHPSAVPDGARLKDFWFPQLVGYPMETAIAVSRLVFSGALERSPLTLCLAHGGGCLPALRGRLDMGWERKEVAQTTSVAPTRIFDQLFYDTAVFDADLLRRLVEDVGADHVMLGTDHPFDLAERDPVGFVAAAGFDRSDAAQICGGNAGRLLAQRPVLSEDELDRV